MGCGKTTFGKKISLKLGYEFIDTDKYIEKNQGMSVQDIFSSKGEDYFRELENQAVIDVCKKTKCIIATGGGIIKNHENMVLLGNCGTIVYLKSCPKHIFRNIGDDKSRPLLQGDNRMEKITQLMEERIPTYEKYANVIVDVTVGTVNQICNRIVKALGVKK